MRFSASLGPCFIFVQITVGDRTQSDLLGGKGANLAEVVRIGLLVPSGSTIKTQACREYFSIGEMPVGLPEKIPAGDHDSARCDDGFSIGTMIETLRTATQLARSLRSDFKFGICGEHGGGPQSIPFLHDLELDYVSCLPFRVPIVWMNANPRTRPAKRDQGPLIFIGGSMSVAMVRLHR